MTRNTTPTLFDPALLRPALLEALKKLDPRVQWRNPVMFVVYVGSAFTTALALSEPSLFTALVALWLWFTVLFANMAEALAEGRSKAQERDLGQAITQGRPGACHARGHGVATHGSRPAQARRPGAGGSG